MIVSTYPGRTSCSNWTNVYLMIRHGKIKQFCDSDSVATMLQNCHNSIVTVYDIFPKLVFFLHCLNVIKLSQYCPSFISSSQHNMGKNAEKHSFSLLFQPVNPYCFLNNQISTNWPAHHYVPLLAIIDANLAMFLALPLQLLLEISAEIIIIKW